MNKKKSSKVYEVPRSTLEDKVISKERDVEKLINMRLVRRLVLP